MDTESCSSIPTTRSKTEIWLIGQIKGELSGNLLSTSNEVLRLFFHYHQTMQETVAKSAKSVAEDVTKIWNNARISTKYQPDIVSKIKSLFDEYTKIKKN